VVSFTVLSLPPLPPPRRLVGPRTGISDLEEWKLLILPGLEFQLLERPSRSQPLYRLRYRGLITYGVQKLTVRIPCGTFVVLFLQLSN
jgi:hypothetical protein